MKSSGTLLITIVAGVAALAGAVRSLQAQTAQSTAPIEVAALPYIEIFSPTFFWNDEADFIRTGSTTCPKGRAITGGMSIQQGKASLRILESYPDGIWWVDLAPLRAMSNLMWGYIQDEPNRLTVLR
jgi:hypothetical protein